MDPSNERMIFDEIVKCASRVGAEQVRSAAAAM
jgi:hypothetical protein